MSPALLKYLSHATYCAAPLFLKRGGTIDVRCCKVGLPDITLIQWALVSVKASA